MSKKLKTPKELYDISGKVAVITGALGAFGGVATRTLSKAGCKLVIADDQQDALNELAAELKQDGGDVKVVANAKLYSKLCSYC